jgi:hypothetical protein
MVTYRLTVVLFVFRPLGTVEMPELIERFQLIYRS